jgi:hypothetical protein
MGITLDNGQKIAFLDTGHEAFTAEACAEKKKH